MDSCFKTNQSINTNLSFGWLITYIYIYVCVYVCMYVCMWVCFCLCWERRRCVHRSVVVVPLPDKVYRSSCRIECRLYLDARFHNLHGYSPWLSARYCNPALSCSKLFQISNMHDIRWPHRHYLSDNFLSSLLWVWNDVRHGMTIMYKLSLCSSFLAQYNFTTLAIRKSPTESQACTSSCHTTLFLFFWKKIHINNIS